jgi:hypothetical protein
MITLGAQAEPSASGEHSVSVHHAITTPLETSPTARQIEDTDALLAV